MMASAKKTNQSFTYHYVWESAQLYISLFKLTLNLKNVTGDCRFFVNRRFEQSFIDLFYFNRYDYVYVYTLREEKKQSFLSF
jgi:hypothetical protein